MKKVLIISYFYPPSNFVGGERTKYWAENLYKYNVVTTVITRNWDDKQIDITDTPKNNKIKVIVNNNTTVHYLPKKKMVRDHFSKKRILKPIQKVFTLINVLTIPFNKRKISFFNFNNYTEKLIKNGEKFDIIIASGRPFESFAIASSISNKYQIPWIADYRDEWNSHYRIKSESIITKLVRILEVRSEKRWTKNANSFITVSEMWRDRIAQFIEKEGHVIQNGFVELMEKKDNSNSPLKIIYVGTLYNYQKIETFLYALKKIENDGLQINLEFLGIEIDPEQVKRVRSFQLSSVTISPRASRSLMYQKISDADYGLLTGYDNLDGCLPVKFYDYLSTSTPIILCPSDNSLMNKAISDLKNGFVVNNVEQCYTLLKSLLSEKKPMHITTDIHQYSREYSTKKLARLINEIK